MNFKIDITKINVVKNNQSDLTYYIATLFCMGINLSTQCYSTFNITNIDNVNDAVNLISLKNTQDAKDKGKMLSFALASNNIEYNYEVDTTTKYTNDYGSFIVID